MCTYVHYNYNYNIEVPIQFYKYQNEVKSSGEWCKEQARHTNWIKLGHLNWHSLPVVD